jgi:hypothetical protein
MSKSIYVGNLSFNTTEATLRGAEYFLRVPLSSTLVALGCANACGGQNETPSLGKVL